MARQSGWPRTLWPCTGSGRGGEAVLRVKKLRVPTPGMLEELQRAWASFPTHFP